MFLRQSKVGIVGGLGPYAGVDILNKVIKYSEVFKDQDHIDVALLSYPSIVSDRTEYIKYGRGENPSIGIIKVISDLKKLGVSHFGIACNTAHSRVILEPVLYRLKYMENPPLFINMIEETFIGIRNDFPNIRNIGVMASEGTVIADTFGEYGRLHGFNIIYPSQDSINLIHEVIYNKKEGLKNDPHNIKASKKIDSVINEFSSMKVEGIILGCTELPLVIEFLKKDLPLIDPGDYLARALIKKTRY
ncbi:MAG: aspartate/glutamate racemase family protein [Spirochaetales bacterium]|nr:aspartate/glutamate racemase family protein [Spirochaetales bacterium]